MKDKKKEEKNLDTEVSRRDFIKGAAAGAVAVAATGVLSACATTGAAGRAAGGPSPVFEPTKIGTLTLKNKIVRGAMADRRYDINSIPTPHLARMWADEAAGGTGMTISGGISVSREDSKNSVFPFLTEKSQVPAYREATEAVHRNGGKICAQLIVVATADGPFNVDSITRENIRQMVNGYAQTAVLARDAGFDAVEFHFAHNYLGSQFWSHIRNKRTDEYGGNAENRARFAFEALEATRRAVGRDYPLIAKIDANVHTLQPGSSQDETNFYAQGLANRGIDAIEISGIGLDFPIRPFILSKEDFNYFSRDARNIARSVNVPMILTGGVRSVFMMEEALRHNDKLVAFGLARTLLFEPDLPNTWQRDPDYTPKCTACNWCIWDPERVRFNYINNNPSDSVHRMNFRATCVFNRTRA